MSIEIEDQYKLNYEKSYVAFLDILGFKKLVYSSKKEDKTKIELYLQTINKAIETLKEIPSKKSIGSIVISDSIILTVPFGEDKDENINNLRQLCIAILSIQRKLVEHDIWMRGGISCGDTFFNEATNQIVGSAYIDAYLLEEKMAKYPRVILDNKIIKELQCENSTQLIDKINNYKKNNPSHLGNVLYNWSNAYNLNVSLEKDIPLFIDYMVDDKETIRKMIQLIEKNTCQNIEVYDKFKWVAKYLMTITEEQALINKLYEI
jgi:hypothetical protein